MPPETRPGKPINGQSAEKPNTRPLSQVLEDLQVKRDVDSVKPVVRVSGHPPLGRLADDGVWEITYSFGADPANIQGAYGVTGLTNLFRSNDAMQSTAHNRERKAILQIMREMEREWNVRFVPTRTPEEANLRVFDGDIPIEKNVSAYTDSADRQHVFIVFNRREVQAAADSSLLSNSGHELLHALGLPHPDQAHGLAAGAATATATGSSPGYNTRGSNLSYNFIDHRTISVFDDMAGAQMYGRPKDGGNAHVITPERLNLVAHGVLWASRPMIIDFAGRKMDGYLMVDLSNPDRVNSGIIGHLKDMTTGTRTNIDTQIAYGAGVKDINMAGTVVVFTVTGTDGSKLTGGDFVNYLTAGNGNNVLTGGKGINHYIFTERSGSGNVIANFSTGDKIKATSSRAELAYREHCPSADASLKGTEVTFIFKDGDRQSRSTVFVKDAMPHEVAKAFDVKSQVVITKDAPEKEKMIRIVKCFDANNGSIGCNRASATILSRCLMIFDREVA